MDAQRRYGLLQSVAEALVKAGDYSVGWARAELATIMTPNLRLTGFKPEADSSLLLELEGGRRHRLVDVSQIWIGADGTIQISVASAGAEPRLMVRLVALRDDDAYETTLARELSRIGLVPSGTPLRFTPPEQSNDQALSQQLAGRVVSHVVHGWDGLARLYFQDGTCLSMTLRPDPIFSTMVLEHLNA